ncbi:hypothetical protein OBK30_01975 [Empedobacter falsenii]
MNNQQRAVIFAKAIREYVKKGYKVIDKDEVNFICTLHREKQKTNHILHLLLTLVTCFLWLLIWGGSAATKKGASTITIAVDEYGNVKNII